VRKKNLPTLVFLFLSLCLFGCFGSVDKRGSVSGFENGVVKTVGGNFRIGLLSSDWKRRDINHRALLFQNHNDGSTITVSSWCKRALDEGSPESLSEQLYTGMSNVKILSAKRIPLADRQAFLTEVTGELDTKTVYLKAYTLKMNECVFDFFFVSTPDRISAAHDLDTLVEGFQYVKGPEIL
jgi:hypothetical protein